MSEDHNVNDEFVKIREALKKGRVIIRNDGKLTTDAKEGVLEPPDGKLAKEFYWYEHDPELFEAEKKVMGEIFPNFKLKDMYGKKMWIGQFESNMKNIWTLAIIYQNDHPNNDQMGGSIRIYSIYPDLNDFSRRLDGLPHTLRDEHGNIYICTARKEDFKFFKNNEGMTTETISAVSALGWASKWIWLFESWINGKISRDDFASHIY